MSIDFFLSICLGVGLAASVGFRVFVPLLALSIASYFNYIPLNESWEWIGSSTALITLAIASILEIGAYFIPWFDNLLDTIAVPLAAVAGTAVMVATMADVDPLIKWTLAIIAGGGTATAISGATSAARAMSTTTTGGIANPVVNTVETVSSSVLSVFSVLIPIVAGILAIFLLIGLRVLYKKVFRKKTISPT